MVERKDEDSEPAKPKLKKAGGTSLVLPAWWSLLGDGPWACPGG